MRESFSGDAKWKGFGFALGAACGRAMFHDNPGDSESNSFLAWNAEAGRPGREIEVEVKTLSSVYFALKEELGFRRPFLKMDTQGYDLQVFGGASDLHTSLAGLQSELALAPYYEGAPGWIESLGRYQEAGFVLSALIPNNSISYPELREIDCIMYRPGFYGK
jgi:FkbM family methyltransferase